jgi:hypothetical protein
LTRRLQLPHKFEGIIAVAPDSGQLRGNETCSVTWSFVPVKQKTYDGRALLALR